MTHTLTPPRAFIRHLRIVPRVTVLICKSCPDREQAIAEARSAEQAVELGLCPACYAIETARWLGDATEPEPILS